MGVQEERDSITFHSDDPLGDDLSRVFRGANEHQVAARNLPEAVGHVFGDDDVAGQVQGGEHAGTVHLQAPENSPFSHTNETSKISLSLDSRRKRGEREEGERMIGYGRE